MNKVIQAVLFWLVITVLVSVLWWIVPVQALGAPRLALWQVGLGLLLIRIVFRVTTQKS